MRFFKILLIMYFLIASSALYAASISIKTTQKNAKVFVSKINSTDYKEIGKTPYQSSLEDFKRNFLEDTSFNIKIKKSGHKDYHFIVSNLGNMKINININMELDQNIDFTKKIDFFVNNLFEAQRLVRSKNYQDAILILTKLEKDFYNYSILYELKGGAYYFNKEYQKALSFYRKSFDLNPENRDSLKMKNYLEKIYAVKK